MLVAGNVCERVLFHLDFLSCTDIIAFDAVQSFQLVNGGMVLAGDL